MSDTERPVVVEAVYKDGKVERYTGPFVLVIDPVKNRLGVKDPDGHVVQIPLSDAVDIIRKNL